MNIINPDALAVVTIWTEAQGELYTGKVAVGEVIRNRMLRNYSSDGTVAGTVLRRYQFSAFNDDAQDNALLIRAFKINDMDPTVQECIRAWNQSRDSNYVKDAVLYCNLDVITRPNWAREDKQIIKIGHHTFFGD
jgi:spore germination cell wall hydrolase CwlJ-like protein